MGFGRGSKTTNEYSDQRLYAVTPKAVFAAVAFSFAARLFEGADKDAIENAIRDEWDVLHQNGIVPQKPPQR